MTKRTDDLRFEEELLVDVFKENPKLKYRREEWVPTGMVQSPVTENSNGIADPRPPKRVKVRIQDLLAIQFLVNVPTVHYYVHLLRTGRRLGRIRVKPYGDKWIVINGTHRVEAYRYMGIEEIPAMWGWWI